MPDAVPAEPRGDLADLAGRYAADALSEADAAAFERLLGADQAARDALCAAVRRQSAEAAPGPDPSYRRRVRDRLRRRPEAPAPADARPGPWARLWARRPYPGHPALWLTAGAAAALLGLLLLNFRPVAPAPTAPTPQPVAVTAPPPPAPETPAPVDPEAEAARVWSQREPSDRLARAVAEEARRKVRAEDRRLAHEERLPRPFRTPMAQP